MPVDVISEVFFHTIPEVSDMSQVFTILKFNYQPLSISKNKTNKNALQTANTWNSKLFKPKRQTLLLINLFKILNIWTQVYYMQNYWTSHGISGK